MYLGLFLLPLPRWHLRVQVTTFPHPTVFLQVLQETLLSTCKVPGTRLGVGGVGLSGPHQESPPSSGGLGCKLGCEGGQVGLRQGRRRAFLRERMLCTNPRRRRQQAGHSGIVRNEPGGRDQWGLVQAVPRSLDFGGGQWGATEGLEQGRVMSPSSIQGAAWVFYYPGISSE